MRLISFVGDGHRRLGSFYADRIIDLQAAHIAGQELLQGASITGGARTLAEAQLPADALQFIEVGASALAVAKAILASASSLPADLATSAGEPVWYQPNQVQILAPITNPGKIICIGLNYKDHAIETNMDIPQSPVLFSKFVTAIIGPNQPIIHPGSQVTQRLDYEAELVVVVGKTARNVTVEQAMEYVFGYTIMNDISARDLQMQSGQWLKGKSLDAFAPIGPALVSADEVPDPHNLRISLKLNGKLMQDSNTKNLIFTVPVLISYISKLMTLLPGDIIATGTPPGVGMARKPPVYMQPGDVVSAEISGLGTLTNPIILEELN